MAALDTLRSLFARDPYYFLSHIDCIHDFKTFLGQDRPNQPRGGDPTEFHYWTGFKHYIMSFDKRGTEINPALTKIFNGCRPVLSAAAIEDNALELSKSLMGVRPVELVYRAPNAFYNELYAILAGYRSTDGKVPFVVDVEYKLNTANTLREFVDQFSICRNKEHYSDPSRAFMRDYGTAAVEEVGSEQRTYDAGDNVNTRLGTVKVSGAARMVNINYGDVITETYKAEQTVFPNSKGQCKGAFTQALKLGDYTGKSFDYCTEFAKNKPLPGAYGPAGLLAIISAHLIKKRLGDQLQVASCRKKIKYVKRNGATIDYGGALPCVFWSFDRVAIAYAILLGIPCVQEFVNGNVHIYIPRVQGGGACSRANLQHTAEEITAGIRTNEPIVDLINGGHECFNRYIELHFETDSIYYDPINCLHVIKFLYDAGPLRAAINPAMFDETYLTIHNNGVPQMYIENDAGEHTDAAVISVISDRPSWVFYSIKYDLYIDHAVTAEGHVFQLRKSSGGATSIGDSVLYAFHQRFLIDKNPLILVQEGGSSSKKKEDPVAHLLSALSSVEKNFVVLTDNRELFTAELKGFDISPVGYTCYDIIFFVKALVKKLKASQNKSLISESVGALFDILKDLGENALLDNLKLFLNTYSKYRHPSTKNYGPEHVKFIKSLVDKSKANTKEIEKALARFKYDLDKMVRYLDKYLPLGTLTKLYNEATSGKSASMRGVKRMASSSAKFLSSISKMPSVSKLAKRSTSKVASGRRSTSKLPSSRRSTSKVASGRRSTSKLPSGSKRPSGRSRRASGISRFRPQLSVLAE